MAKKGAPQKNTEDVDIRPDFFLNYLTKAMRMKSDKWSKMMNTDEYRVIFYDFLNKPELRSLVMTLSGAGALTPQYFFPSNCRTKSCYFNRVKKEVLTNTNLLDVLVFGDISPKPVDELGVLVEEIFLPLVSNPENTIGWPQIIIEDIQKHLFDFRSVITQVKGAMGSETLLPMPAGAERAFEVEQRIRESEGEETDLELKSAIEGSIIKWTSTINEILTEKSTVAFAEGAHPTPMREIEFWKFRLRNLESIYEQLRDPRVKKMATILEITESAYLSCFKTMFRNVVAAVTEARDITVYLKPCAKHFESLEGSDFSECRPYLKPALHCVCLLWAKSRYYCLSSKITVFVREFGNLLIQECTKQLDPGSVFQGESEDSYKRFTEVIEILKYFVQIFEENRGRIAQFFPEGVEPVMWTFHPRTVFERLFQYITRLETIHAYFATVIEFSRLDKIEIAGIKGRTISASVTVILEEFGKLNAHFVNSTYDSLNVADPGFEDDYARFLDEILDLDRKLAALFSQAYDDCFNLESIFKLLTIMGNLIDRPVIKEEVCAKFDNIIAWLHRELDDTKAIYDEGLRQPQIPRDNHFPPIAGALFWLFKLRERVIKPIADFRALENELNKTANAKFIFKKYDQMMALLNATETKVFTAWVKTVPGQISSNMNKAIMTRGADTLIALNFADELVAILREVRYLNLLQKEGVPTEALVLYERNEELQTFIGNLNRTVEWYNLVRNRVTLEEYDMILPDLQIIDKMIDEAIAGLTWNMDIWESINELHIKMEDLKSRVLNAQGNIERVLENISLWADTFLFDRRDGKFLAIEDRKDRVQKRYDCIQKSAEELANALDENYKLYYDIKPEPEVIPEPDPPPDPEPVPVPVPEPKGKGGKKGKDKKGKKGEAVVVEISPPEAPAVDPAVLETQTLAEELEIYRQEKWLRYLDYIDGLIKDAMLRACLRSMDIFIENMDTSKDHKPLMQIILELNEPSMIFVPPIEESQPNNFIDLIHGFVIDITSQADLMPRVAMNTAYENYRVDVETNEEYMSVTTLTINRVISCLEKIQEYSRNFDKYAHLWTEDRDEFLQMFLVYGRALTEEEVMFMSGDNAIMVPETPPTIVNYKSQIDHYEDLYAEVDKLETRRVFDTWLRLDVRPLRQAILNHIRKWGNLLKDHLVNHVINSLNDLEEFINEAIRELNKPVVEGDYEALIHVMHYLIKVKERIPATDPMFPPLKEIIELLKLYKVEFEEEVHIQLQELPDRWNSTKKLAVNVKQAVTPLQQMEVTLIKKRLYLFEIRQMQYRERFCQDRIFYFDCSDPYMTMDREHLKIKEYEELIEQIKEAAELFEVVVGEYKPIQFARRDLRLVKQLWDYIMLVVSCVKEWEKTLWVKIDVESMEMDCKKFAKEVRALDKEMRVWDAYIQLEGLVKNMLTSLRAVTELQNPSIRERHWAELMIATKVQFSMDDKTTFKDMLDLNLHKFEDDVKNIVDKSVKEMAMEKSLREMVITWGAMEFEYEYHERSKSKLLKIGEELVEILEDNQVQLQNMMSSKYIAFFLAEVSDWQKKLSNADQVIGIWFEVQRKWMYLESIFIGSEDIRNQLPDESRRFDRIDKTFRLELLTDMARQPNVVRATNVPGLFDKLDGLYKDLVICEKALNDYLDTKRVAYPRFYFVSSSDLLDILSNGNAPELVAKHLTKLYDSLAKLKFIKEGDKSGKKARGMWAKDDEYVEFLGFCDCAGKVEVWLNRITDIMRRTLHHNFHGSVYTYEDKPRDVWIFDWPAQPALCGTQIWWTTEVNISFGRLEEGFENAMKDYLKKQIMQLNNLIVLLLGDLTTGDRQKIMTICTIDVHSRDVVAKIITEKIDNSAAFMWQSQLRHRWDDKENDCFANICDAQFRYDYEYLGNTPRLVITPLTDRCYITLTQSLHLILGGAPAGPAGTGKTETTKDLGKALGVMVYVFNCSEQMDYKSCGNIYKGLAQTGAWGCFDEFNRIAVEVLSVVAVQVKTLLDAIKWKKARFWFMGEEIVMIATVGMFITMNPGYAGRAELPENLKALFRPCAMVVPDFALICEIMLVAEGFQEARLLARKFITLYTLCKELLSKQDHYDWGLRAIKSVLVVAGSLKRGDRHRPEDQVLMRALRDFNVPKIVTDDTPVFMGLIGDLFPALDVPRKRDPEFENECHKAALDLSLQPEDGFILKIVQLQELFAVRHSVFIIGFAGTGKSEVWRTLYRCYQNLKRKPMYNDLNPKAVTNDELFGIINPATREWKDGLISVLMREQALLPGTGSKWLVLDGDIDPMWIESLNTVMDDNKVLTLASNERIALTPQMRLLFEISNLRTATPATVSRAGILYINPQDLGWNPYVASWIDTRTIPTEKANLTILFDKYVNPCLDVMKKLKKITPIPDCAHLEMLCFLLECLLIPQNTPNECPKEWYEMYFVFSCVWAFGSSTFQDQLVDWRNEFSKWWLNEFKSVKFPSTGTVFNFFIESETKRFLPWSERVRDFQLDTEVPLSATLVDTAETSRYRYFMDMLMEKKKPCMLVGSSGSGKSVIVADKLANLSDNYIITNVPFNFYTSSEMLQRVLEKPLEKKAGRNYGPPGTKLMIYFIDDLNMPEVDLYGTVQPHTLIRQHMDYGHWYDRVKISLKDIHNIQYVSCMNPTAGSFVIDPRLQRHFCVFAVSFPTVDALYRIYEAILSQHLANPILKFVPPVQKISELLVNVALSLHTRMAASFLPTAVKFHYIFNLRDLSNIFQGILFTTGDAVKQPIDLIRLYVHEATRVYGDKLVDKDDQINFQKLVLDCFRKGFEELDEAAMVAKPLIFCHFAEGIGDPKYMQILAWPHLQKLLEDALSAYNELIATMNLVLFEDAMFHLCRINRILESPRGNALLIGVGGSGKQSLSRLASSISSLGVFQVQLRKGYSINDLKLEFNVLYTKAGLKSNGTVFLMTDSQVAEESFLVVINDILASGEIPELYADDEMENIINGVRNEVKGIGLPDTKENCWVFFINRVRRLLKLVLCFSPVGSTLRVRARKFPAVVNCTSIDWFHEWPQDALESVSHRFLSELEVLPVKLVRSVSLYMSYCHTVVNRMSQTYLQNERRYNYTTPKSFLELIALYSKLLRKHVGEVGGRINALTIGLEKLVSTAGQVDGMKETLAIQEVELVAKNKAAEELIEVVNAENEKVGKEKDFAAEEEKKVRVIEEDVTIKAKICSEDLLKAEPALLAAQEALNTLNKNNLTELKSFGSPPEAVVNVCAGVMVLMSPKGKVPKDRSWKAAKVMMGKVDQFLNDLIYYDKENIHPDVVKAIQPYIKDKEFDPDFIMAKSSAAAGLCAWVINIMRFYDVYVVVEPKRRALNKANQDLRDARQKLEELNAKLQELEEMLMVLQNEFETAVNAKLKCQAEADATAVTIDLANRLVNGLASEKIRWGESVVFLKKAVETLPGDILQISSFISYVGCFTRGYRLDLIHEYWVPFLEKLDPPIPKTEGLDPLNLLTDDAQIAVWNNEALPSDRMSTENATILTNSARWPLMIDPQLQGIKWIKTKYGEQLIVIRLTMRNYIDMLERALMNGSTVLIENIGETVDAVLDPLLGRMLIKKGRAVKIGDKEMDFNENFRLILHTKLANPHYKPEMQAQTTLINFTVTRDGLEEQLLAEVVKAERPDLDVLKAELTKQQNHFKITLKTCEENLLHRLSSASGNIVGDVSLVQNLETTKKTAAEIAIKVEEAKITTVQIDEAREQYRPAAGRASLLYFILNDLNKISPMYQYSLKAFTVVFNNAILTSAPGETVPERVTNLIDNITFCVFMYTSRGLFERDKLIFMAQMTLQILAAQNELPGAELDFLLRFPITPVMNSPVDFLTLNAWGGIKTLANMDEFRNLDKDIEGAAKRWKSLVDAESPENEKLPQDWKNKSGLQKLCMMRCLRPDRMTYAVRGFVEEKMGSRYITARTVEFARSYEESSPITPMFFILSAGVDPTKDVETLGRTLGFSSDNLNFHNVSLGQGQEEVAENAMEVASREGHWVILQNIHLVAKWLSSLDKKMEQCNEGAHDFYRLFLSAEPAADPAYHILPQGVLESSIKITNEPPTGMQANLHKALDNFNQDTLEMSTKETEFKAILFSLCYFHACVAERRKFGPQGWNRSYPFNVGDLTISVYVLYNYLELNNKVPWEDLRYLFGEIMYGGHITDDWDRRLCKTFLQEYMYPDLIDSDLYLAPNFLAPPNMDYVGYHQYIDDALPPETPTLYGLHPNAEIGFLTKLSETLFRTIFELQPRDSGASTTSVSREETVKTALEDIYDKLPDLYNLAELATKVEELTPFIIVAFQECERMNFLVKEMRDSLKELELGMKGELTITKSMEDLEEKLFMDVVPPGWEKRAYPSMLPLGSWFADLTIRMRELEAWANDFALPPAVWLAGFFNPQSFLTAIMQQTARKNEWPLDKMCLNCDVTKRQRSEFTAPPREGAYICGLFMEGARWDTKSGSIVESILKDLFPMMPVVFIKAVTQDKQDVKNVYACPVYKTRQRGPTFVWTFNLKTKEKEAKWTMAGVGVILQT